MNDREREDPDLASALPLVGAALLVAAIAWAIPSAVTLLYAHRLSLSAAEAIVGTFRLAADGRWSDPATAYGVRAHAFMPDALTWWLIAGTTMLAVSTAAYVCLTRLDVAVGRERLGRRPYDPRGARPRPWARRRDLGPLRARRASTGFSLGSIDGRRLAADPEAHVAVIAPTRSGKTTRCIIPWLLEHDGPALVTSTKRDVVEATYEARADIGNVWIFDPFSDDPFNWSPLQGCENWSHALRQSLWLADATQEGDSEIAGYWRGEAAKLLAPLMHAAALDRRPMDDVLAWLDAQETEKPTELLEDFNASAAARQLSSVLALDPRNQGTTFMSAGSVLAAYRFPEVVATAGSVFEVETLVRDEGADTLYIVAADRHQRLLAPIVVALVSGVLHAAAERAAADGPKDPPLRLLLDEAANIAPLRELPRYVSQAAGYGVRVATVWQSLAQLRERYRDGSDVVLANSTAKLFMGPVTDVATRRYVAEALGPRREARDGRDTEASSRALQQLSGDRALLLAGSLPPAVVRSRPWWR
jgi:type IV secretion system protein VirD4